MEVEGGRGAVAFEFGFKAMRWPFVILGVASAGAFGGTTFTLTKGGFELAHISA